MVNNIPKEHVKIAMFHKCLELYHAGLKKQLVDTVELQADVLNFFDEYDDAK